MIGRFRGLARAAAFRIRQEGLVALRRVPKRLKTEIASMVRGRSRWPRWVPRVAFSTLYVDRWSEENVRRLNREAKKARADWLLLLPRDAKTVSHIRGAFSEIVTARPDADIIYADEDFREMQGLYVPPRLKPDFNPTLLLAQNYIGFPVLVRKSLFLTLGGLREELRSGAAHHMWLRAWKAGAKFVRLPGVLVHNRTTELSPVRAETLKALSAFCRESTPELMVRPGATADSVEVYRLYDKRYPEITLVIPTCQTPCGAMAREGESPEIPHIVYLLESLLQSTWPKDRLRVLIADDRRDGSCYSSRSWPFHVERFVTARRPADAFNYARKMNEAWRKAGTDAVILMNDDVRVRSPGWIEALMTFAMDPDVGGVGARLLFPNGRLQHAGIVAGPFETAVHAWFDRPSELPTYQDWALVHRDWSMVTGAVFATRRAILDQVGGFDERFALEFNDLDLCLRIGLLGYRIVCTPFAELIHFEKSSRGADETPPHERLRFIRRWKQVIANDPAYNPGLSRDSYQVRPIAA